MSDPIPKRLLVKKKLAEWLEGITVANGYLNDLSRGVGGTGPVRVFRGRNRFGENDALPCCAILESPRPDADAIEVGSGRAVLGQYMLLIQGWVPSDASDVHPTDAADYLLADLKKRVGALIGNDLPPNELQSHHNLYGLVADVLIEPGTVRPPDEFSALSYCYFRVVFPFVERFDDLYAT